MKIVMLFLICTFPSSQYIEHFSSNPNEKTFQGKEHLKKEVVIFVYHRFGESKYPSTNISLENFENQLKYLQSKSFEVLTFGEAIEYINNPAIDYKGKTACITIDDGFKSFKRNAVPLLKKYGFNSTIFINSESVDWDSYMTWDELKEISSEGIEIGNHSHSHKYFLNIPKATRIDVFKKDLTKCQEEIFRNLGFYPDIFAYPYGEFDPDMKEAVADLGFKAAAAQNSGVLYLKDMFAVPRFPMAGPFAKMEGFIEKANMNALRVINELPSSFLLTDENPPKITVAFDTTMADISRHSCFSSVNCSTDLHENTMTIQGTSMLKNRRTLYKITAPGKSGKGWYWYSHLWIRPEIEE